MIAQLEKFRAKALQIGNITWTHACHISKQRSLPIVTFVGTKEKFVAEVSAKRGILPPTLC